MTNSEIIEGLKAIRTIHNGNYAPYVDEAIKRLSAEPCEDAVNREDLEECIELMTDINGYTLYAVKIADVRKLPPVKPKSKIGHWIHGRCSECRKDGLLESTGEYVCNTFVYRVARSKYCPNCGVRMVESEEE